MDKGFYAKSYKRTCVMDGAYEFFLRICAVDCKVVAA